MTGRNTSQTTAAGVVDIIKQVWYIAIDVIAGGSSLRSLGGTFSEGAKHIEDTSAAVYRASSDDRPQYFTHNSVCCRGHHQTRLVSCGHHRRRSQRFPYVSVTL